MNREIKFRIWDTKEEKFIVNETDRLANGDTKKCMSERIDFFEKSVEINANERYIILEYTGLIDKKNREIYEGDIIQFRHPFDGRIIEKTSVVYLKGQASFGIIDKSTNELPLYKITTENYAEVIGNIYEN